MKNRILCIVGGTCTGKSTLLDKITSDNELMEKYTLHDLATIIAHYLLQDKHKYKKINLTPEPSVILKGQAKIRNIKNRINKFNHNSRSNNSKNNNKQTAAKTIVGDL